MATGEVLPTDVRLPNGKIVRNVPPGMSQKKLFALAVEAGFMKPEEVPGYRPPPPARGSILDPLMQGMTHYSADELAGVGARIGSNLSQRWFGVDDPGRTDYLAQQATQDVLQRFAEYRKRQPAASFVAELIGNAFAAAPGMKLATAPIAGAASTGTRMATIGTLEGALAGTMAADPGARVIGALLGGSGGLFGAGIVPSLAYAMRYGRGKLGDWTEPFIRRLTQEPTTTAARTLTEAIEQDALTPSILRARQRQLGPDATLADIGGSSTLTLAQGVAQNKSGQGLSRARREFGRRTAGSTGRLRGEVAEATGIKGRLQPTLDAVRARQKAYANYFYGQARQQTMPLTPKLKALLKRPKMRVAFEEAKERALNRGEELPAWFQLDEYGQWEKTGVMPDLDAWDHMKRGLDRIIKAETDLQTGRISEKGWDAVLLKRELLTELDQLNEPYRVARQLFAGDEALQNAMRQGEKFLNMKTREVNELSEHFTDSEREGFLTGAVEAIRERIGRAREGEIGQFRFLETENIKEKLRAILPRGKEGDRALAQIMRTLRRERTFATTQALVTGGTQTALRQAAGQALESGVRAPTSTEALRRPLTGLANVAMDKIANELGQISQASLRELGELLYTPGNVEVVIRELQRRGMPAREVTKFVDRFAKAGYFTAPYLGGTLGGQTYAVEE